MKFQHSKDHRVCHYTCVTPRGDLWHVWRRRTEYKPRKFITVWEARKVDGGPGLVTAVTRTALGVVLDTM